MEWPFVSRKKLHAAQQANGQLLRQLDAAHREMRQLDGAPIRDNWTLPHRIRVYRLAMMYQPLADEAGKTYTWACGDVAVLNEVDASSAIPEPPSFHQHSVKPRAQREEKV